MSGVTAGGADIGGQIAGITSTVGGALSEFGMGADDVVMTRHFMLPEAQFDSPP